MPWTLVVGVLALFAAVSALGPLGLDRVLRDVAGTAGGLRLSATAAAAGNLVDNLPAYLALERVTPPREGLALLVGVNAGTLLTPWGSLATLLWASSVPGCRAVRPVALVRAARPGPGARCAAAHGAADLGGGAPGRTIVVVLQRI